ncbi:Serine threonine- kinase Nek11, partial [Paramuricea clavata]
KVLKEISVGELKEDETFDAQREANLLAKLDHPNIVKFLDSFVYMESYCIVTELCEGGDLTEKIKAWKKSGRTFDESLIVAWLVQLLLAIQFIHKKKILHRDLKTRNIFLKNNMIKIGDFGISRILMGTSDMATTFTGTPYYMSPEILKHEGYNSKSDIWALGVVLYELCTLDHAFEGQNLLGVMYKIVEGETPALPEKFHPEFRKIFNGMLSKDPIQRPSASELLTNLYISKHVKEIKMKIEQHNTHKSDATNSSR